jgi:hypothetical protein
LNEHLAHHPGDVALGTPVATWLPVWWCWNERDRQGEKTAPVIVTFRATATQDLAEALDLAAAAEEVTRRDTAEDNCCRGGRPASPIDKNE